MSSIERSNSCEYKNSCDHLLVLKLQAHKRKGRNIKFLLELYNIKRFLFIQKIYDSNIHKYNLIN